MRNINPVADTSARSCGALVPGRGKVSNGSGPAASYTKMYKPSRYTMQMRPVQPSLMTCSNVSWVVTLVLRVPRDAAGKQGLRLLCGLYHRMSSFLFLHLLVSSICSGHKKDDISGHCARLRVDFSKSANFFKKPLDKDARFPYNSTR